MAVYPYLKALHLVFVVSWFAGLLYVVRLFIYHVEAGERPEAERGVLQPQLLLMARRLWYAITWPAMLLATFFGLWLMVLLEAWRQPWFHVKASLLVLLFLYHIRCGSILRHLGRGTNRLTSRHLRVWNEVATLLLFAIVFVAVLKNPAAAAAGMGWVALAGALLVAILALLRRRKGTKMAPSSPDRTAREARKL